MSSGTKFTIFYDSNYQWKNKNYFHLLVFDDRNSPMEYHNVDSNSASDLLNYIISRDGQLKEIPSRSIPKSQFSIFVCSHTARDARCGYCGPVILYEIQQRLNTSFKNRNLEMKVYPCSHVGGHVFAANILCFKNNIGDWFGNISPAQVPILLDYFSNPHQEIKEHLQPYWRGRMGNIGDNTFSESEKQKIEKI